MAKLILVICCLFLGGVGKLNAQQAQPQTPEQTPKETASPPPLSAEDTKLLLDIITAELQARTYVLAPDSNKDNAGATNKLSEAYAKATKSPQLVRFLLGRTLLDYLELKEGARGAAQVSQAADEAGIKFQLLIASQNQTLIEQNQRIINLLEQLVRKR